jgi:hypothetical protein
MDNPDHPGVVSCGGKRESGAPFMRGGPTYGANELALKLMVFNCTMRAKGWWD